MYFKSIQTSTHDTDGSLTFSSVGKAPWVWAMVVPGAEDTTKEPGAAVLLELLWATPADPQDLPGLPSTGCSPLSALDSWRPPALSTASLATSIKVANQQATTVVFLPPCLP